MNKELIEKLYIITAFKEEFESRLTLTFEEFSDAVQEFYANCDRALYSNDFDKFNDELSPDNYASATKIINTSKSSLSFIKNIIENNLRGWSDVEEQLKKHKDIRQNYSMSKMPQKSLNIITNSKNIVIDSNLNGGGNIILGENNNINTPNE